MKVARSSYYAWCNRTPSKTEIANQQLTEQITTVFDASDQTSGSPRISEELKEQQVACSQKRVARLMRQAALKAVLPKHVVVTTDSNPALPVAENILDRQFVAEKPNTR